MTHETEVAQELVRAWPECWREGMLAVFGRNQVRVTGTLPHPYGDGAGATMFNRSTLGWYPALSDGATRGALLQGLRELTNRPFLSTRYDPLNGWAVADFSERITGWHDSEGIAIAKAIIEVKG